MRGSKILRSIAAHVKRSLIIGIDQDDVGLSSELSSLVPDADVVVNCVPLTPETHNMFDDEFFSLMKALVIPMH